LFGEFLLAPDGVGEGTARNIVSMASPRRRTKPSLIEALFQRPDRLSFFQAVRLLEWGARRNAKDPRLEAGRPVGEDHEPRQQVVRFRAPTNLSFARAEIASVRQEPGERPSLTVGFFGLTGTMGAMPGAATDMVARALREKEVAHRDFLDLFNDRLVALFYRAWAKYRLPIAYEREHGTRDGDTITRALRALVGFGTGRLRDRLAIDDDLVLHQAGAFSRRARSAVTIERVLTEALDRPVRVEQFRVQMVSIPLDAQTRLPSRRDPAGAFCRLGEAVAGARAFEAQGGVRLQVGPLAYTEFQALRPGSDEARRFADLARLALGSEFDFDVALTLETNEVPALCLNYDPDHAMRLGWNTWLPGQRADGATPTIVARL
jgi:type VI secretion system protein ImpH